MDACAFHHFYKGYRRGLIGEKSGDFGDVSKAHHGVSSKLGVVGDKKDLAGIVDDGPGGPHLTVVEIEEGAVYVDAADADDAEIHPELLNEVYGGLPDNPAVAMAHQAAGDDHLEIFVCGQNRGYVEIVCDHPQALVMGKRPGHGFGRRSDIDEQGSMVGDLPGDCARDLLLFIVTEDLSLIVGQVLGAGDCPRRRRGSAKGGLFCSTH